VNFESGFDETDDEGRDFTFDQRIEKLRSRGMAITDSEVEWLRRVGYYRVKPYWQTYIPLVENELGRKVRKKASPFKPGTTFANVRANYLTDAKLRHKLFAGIENVEVAFREAISDVLQQRFGRYAQYENDIVTPYINPKTNKAATDHGQVMRDALLDADQNKDSHFKFVKDYKKNLQRKNRFDDRWPIWQGVEVVTFGQLQGFHSTLTDTAVRLEIAERMGYSDDKFFIDAMRQMNFLRNRCAHHARIFNYTFMRSYSIPGFLSSDIPVAMKDGQIRSEIFKTYALICVLVDMNLRIDPKSAWVKDLYSWISSPQVSEFFLRGAGFPMENWKSRPLWSKSGNRKTA